ncbi:6'''-hydroxyparomomycin C oxidase [Alphaproteobacteria bacterium SO-S41]|nr:6'''-hydroxyparomomycin C oxidase [Alphaproteobacteria bacterium SO-S41]
MFIDGRSLSTNDLPAVDIAIVGAGAAGITLARALAGSGAKIALIESGGLDWAEDAQDLAAGDLGEQTYGALDAVRLRQFGGTTGHWGGWCRELDAIDFEARDHIPFSGWPIAKTDLDPYYVEAQDILHLGTARYHDSEGVAAENKVTLPVARDAAVEPVLFEFSPPIRMGEVYRDELGNGPVAVYLNTTVADIRVSDDRRSVTTLRLARDGGSPVALAARHVVIACGGLSNAQILLQSDQQMAGGVGNANDQVGRYFAEHPILIGYAAILSLGDAAGGPFAFADIGASGRRYRLAFQPSEATRRRESRLSTLITIEPPGPTFDPATGLFDRADARWFGPPETIQAIAQLQAKGKARIHMLNAGLETRPNPDSRVLLSADRDRFGLRRIKLDWRLTDKDLEDYLANLADFAKGLAKAGTAVLRIAPDARERFPGETSWGNHHMGTTRMGTDPTVSVCDRDCRVHGLANLWIAGSSVYPTPGAANPTLTLVALALRLADRLKAELAA